MSKTKQKQSKVSARHKATTASQTSRERLLESDGTYFLKLIVFVLLGTLWLKFKQPVTWLTIPLGGIPLGLLVGLLLVRQFETYQTDRKIWYAILVVVTILCYFVPAGILI